MREVYGGVRIVGIVTRNLARSRAFWIDRLGFAAIDEEKGRRLVVNCGTFRLRVEPEGEANPARGGGATFVFRVRNTAKTAKELEARGVAYECRTAARTGDFLEAFDPDGYRIVFTERP